MLGEGIGLGNRRVLRAAVLFLATLVAGGRATGTLSGLLRIDVCHATKRTDDLSELVQNHAAAAFDPSLAAAAHILLGESHGRGNGIDHTEAGDVWVGCPHFAI